jgi:hypothetical protein
MWSPKDRVDKPLYVVTSITNFRRFKTRYKLARDFLNHVRNAGAIPVIVEGSLRDRDHALEEHGPWSDKPLQEPVSFGPPPNPPRAHLPHQRIFQDYLKLRLGHLQEIWLKECLQNYGAMHIPSTDGEEQYIAFIDADIAFDRPDWVSETLHELQRYDVVQMFSRAIDLTPDYEPLSQHMGFVYCHQNGVPMPPAPGYYYGHETPGKPINTWHPGFAWAWRRSALNKVGRLFDYGILGAGDNHMARGLIGKADQSYHPRVHAAYKRKVLEWQERAADLHQNIGYVKGTIKHFWHGRKIHRRYADRWQILVKNQFNPDKHLHQDITGIHALRPDVEQLRDDIRAYFAQRHEDSIDVSPSDYKMVGPLPWPEDK